MNLKNRISELERQRGLRDDPMSWSVTVYLPGPVTIEGISYGEVEDVPAELRRKYKNTLIAGTIRSRRGWEANVFAPALEEGQERSRTETLTP